jgi:hypothetical protein
MIAKHLSECGRFVVVEGLHIDRNVFEALGRWATDHGLGIQDAVQLALCSFNERNAAEPVANTVLRVHDCGHPLRHYRPWPLNGSTSVGSGFLAFRTAEIRTNAPSVSGGKTSKPKRRNCEQNLFTSSK